VPRPGLIDDIVALARIPAPTFAEERRLAWVEERLRGAGGRVARGRAGNVVWRWGDGRPRVLVAAHVDTVFPAEARLDVERHPDALVGPGVGDNAAAVAVTIDVVEELLRGGVTAPGAVAFTVGEEGLGNLRGAIAACEELAPETFVAVEGHGLDAVIADSVGSVRALVAVSPSAVPVVIPGSTAARRAPCTRSFASVST
jgi:putative aminopeptidase FrvX